MATEIMSFKIQEVLILLFMINFVCTYTYPYYGEGQYFRGIPIRSYIPVPVTHYRNEYQLPDYDDGLIANPQDDYEYNMYERYPYAQYYAYRPDMEEFYYDKSPRRNPTGYGYYEGQVPRDAMNAMSPSPKTNFNPYGQEGWYEEDFPRYDSNAKANAAFIQNLMMAQMYQDARNQYAPVYESSADDYDDQHWVYGVPKYGPDEKDSPSEYKEDEEVKELESLARKSDSKMLKDPIKTRKTGNNKSRIKLTDAMEKPTKSKSKMTDDEYFDLQKQIIVNSRKNKYTPVTKALKFNKKQLYNNPDEENNVWENQSKKSWPSYLEAATNSIKKINLINNPKSLKEIKISDAQTKIETSSATAVTSTPAPKRPPSIGQKEVVLPRPSNPVRRPFSESARNLRQPSIYEELEKLLNMNKDFQKGAISRPQKRFVLSEDQLTAQLTGLKKFSD